MGLQGNRGRKGNTFLDLFMVSVHLFLLWKQDVLLNKAEFPNANNRQMQLCKELWWRWKSHYHMKAKSNNNYYQFAFIKQL